MAGAGEAGSSGVTPASPATIPDPVPATEAQVAAEAGVAPEAAASGAGPAAEAVGPASPFGTPDEEVARLTRGEKTINYYAALKISPENIGDLRKHYFKLSRLVHPDKCSNPKAAEAQAVVTQAYATLSNPVKKRLYDAYASDVDTEKPEGMSYAEWESRPVEIPQWLERILRIPGGGVCLLIFLIPLLLILFIVMLLLFLLCLPVRCACRVCCGVKPDEEDQAAASGTAAQQASGQQTG